VRLSGQIPARPPFGAGRERAHGHDRLVLPFDDHAEKDAVAHYLEPAGQALGCGDVHTQQLPATNRRTAAPPRMHHAGQAQVVHEALDPGRLARNVDARQPAASVP
jgi:hypothetical protein